MEDFKVEILNLLTKDSICTLLCDSMSLIDVIRSFSRSGYFVQVHPQSFIKKEY